MRKKQRSPGIAACAWVVRMPGCESVTVVERTRADGRTVYAVTKDGLVANDKGQWETEPGPRDRSDEYLARTHHEQWDTACDLAEQMVVTPAPRP